MTIAAHVARTATRTASLGMLLAITFACSSPPSPPRSDAAPPSESRPGTVTVPAVGDRTVALPTSPWLTDKRTELPGGLRFPARALDLQELTGGSVTVPVGPKTLVVGVATWCQISRQFAHFVADKRIKPMLAGYTLIFVLADEWDAIERMLKEQDANLAANPRLLKAELEERKSDAGNGPLYDPAVLDELPGRFYLHANPMSVGIDSFPTLYASDKDRFDEHPTRWIGENLLERSGMSVDTYLEIWKSHATH